LETKREQFEEIFSQFLSVHMLMQRNNEALEKSAGNVFFSEKETRKKPQYLEEIFTARKKEETIDFPFIMIELKDPNDVNFL